MEPRPNHHTPFYWSLSSTYHTSTQSGPKGKPHVLWCNITKYLRKSGIL